MSQVNLTSQVLKELNAYNKGLKDAIEQIAEKVANDGASELQATTGTYNVRTGEYNKSWAVKDQSKENYVQKTIYNKKHYRLTHLLEYGHATRSGGRTKAFPHIEKVEQEVTSNFERLVEQKIKELS